MVRPDVERSETPLEVTRSVLSDKQVIEIASRASMEDFRKAQEAIERKEEKPITHKVFKVV